VLVMALVGRSKDRSQLLNAWVGVCRGELLNQRWHSSFIGYVGAAIYKATEIEELGQGEGLGKEAESRQWRDSTAPSLRSIVVVYLMCGPTFLPAVR